MQVAEQQVNRLCVEAQECMVMGRWLDLASLILTSAEVIFSNSKVLEKGNVCDCEIEFYNSFFAN